MKKALLILGTLACLLALPVGLPRTALAVDTTSVICQNPDITKLPVSQRPSVCQDNQNGKSNPLFGPTGLLTTVIRILSTIIGVAALIVIIIGGLRIVLSGGDANNVAGGRQAILFALIGLAVAAIAQIIVAFVLNKIS